MRIAFKTRMAACLVLVTLGVIVVVFDDWQYEMHGSYTTLAGIGTRFVGYGLLGIGVVVASALAVGRTRRQRL
jgi:uncharacterized protein YjeT (DUF2065 family)